ncbi:MAG: alpha/beta fold hydrolase [Xanthobacteraceae bacterium]
MTRHAAPHSESFTGADGNRLVADVFGTGGRPVALLHGGGQTRHAWRKTAELIAQADMIAYAIDQRGHGDSDWVASGAYAFMDFAHDVRAIAQQLEARHGAKAVIAGASLGGIAALSAEGEAAKKGEPPLFAGLVLVDITPRVDMAGVAKVQGFMRAHAHEGFATVEEAADAVAAYLPHRPRPRSNEGLKKNLRLHPDGRWRWHWDPKFLDSRKPDSFDRGERERSMVEAAKSLKMPVLLVRGGSSELVTEAHAREFLDLVPHATYADVAGARHMVAGDRNDQFSEAIMNFLKDLP